MTQPVVDDTIVYNGDPADIPSPADLAKKNQDSQPESAEPKWTPEKYEAEIQKLRRESAGYRTKLREAEPLVKAAQDAEESNKTEIQKAIDRASQAEQTLAERETAFNQLDLIVRYNLDPEDSEFIGSGSREEMEDRAQRLAARVGSPKPHTAPPSDRPVEGLKPGASPEPPKPPDDSYPAAWTPPYIKNRNQYGQ